MTKEPRKKLPPMPESGIGGGIFFINGNSAMLTAVVFTAAMFAAGVTAAVMFAMMIAADVGIIAQFSGEEGGNCRIGIAGYTAAQTDAGSGYRRLRTAADTAADQHIGVECVQNTGKSAVTAAVGVHYG